MMMVIMMMTVLPRLPNLSLGTRRMYSDIRLLVSITGPNVAGIERSIVCGVSVTNKQLFDFMFQLNAPFVYYTGCNRRNGPDFGRVFLRSYCTDITQNTYIQSSMVTEILAREV